MRRPKRVISSKIAYKNPYYKVVQDTFETASKKKGNYYYIEAPEFVVVIALSANMKHLYMVKNWRYPVQRYNWEFVMGWKEKNETLLMSAKRELREELGMKAKKYKRLGWFYLGPGISNQKGYVYLAYDPKPMKDAIIDTEEIAASKKFSLKQLQELVTKRKIIDAPTLMAITYLYNELY